MNILITGHSRGIGAALAKIYLARGASVFGIARHMLEHDSDNLAQRSADLTQPMSLSAILDDLLPASMSLDLVYLNAGVLGPIDALSNTSLTTLREVMDINVWANKVVLDWLVQRTCAAKQVILMSSGASLSGNYGWGAYALSKATLNMLTQLYAHELPQTHLTAFAPGLVDTDMQEAIRGKSADDFPSLRRLHAAKGSPDMPTPDVVAQEIVALSAALRQRPSGSYVDLRTLRPS